MDNSEVVIVMSLALAAIGKLTSTGMIVMMLVLISVIAFAILMELEDMNESDKE